MRFFLKNYFPLRIIGFGILLWLLLHIEINRIIEILLKSHLDLLIAALLSMIIHVYIKFLRYQHILVQQGVTNPLIRTVHYSLAAIYLSFVTPARLGEVSKAYFIHKANGVPLNRLLAGSLLDRIFDVYILLFTALLGFAIINPIGTDHAPIILIIIAIALIPPVFLSKIVREILINLTICIQRKITGSDTWSDHLGLFFSEIQYLLNWKIFWGVAATFAAYAFFFGSCYFMSLSVDIPLSYFKIAIFIACANILSFLPVSFAGIGTREAVLVYLFSTENLSAESALAFSTIVFSFTYLLFGLIGFFCFMTLKKDKTLVPKNA